MSEDRTKTKTKYKDLSPNARKQRDREIFETIYKNVIGYRTKFLTTDEPVQLTEEAKTYLQDSQNHLDHLMFRKHGLDKVGITMESDKVTVPPELQSMGIDPNMIAMYHYTKHSTDELWTLASQYRLDHPVQSKKTKNRGDGDRNVNILRRLGQALIKVT